MSEPWEAAECGAKRLVPLSFQAARAAADDLERPEVVVLRPRAKCGGCGARIYPDTVTHRGDLSESAQIKSRQSAYAGGLGRAKGKNIPLNPGVTTSLLVRPQGFGPALFRACSLPTPSALPAPLLRRPRSEGTHRRTPQRATTSPRPISLGGASGRLTAAPTAERLSCRRRLLSNRRIPRGVARKQPGVNVACSTVPVVFASCALPCTMAQRRAGEKRLRGGCGLVVSERCRRSRDGPDRVGPRRAHPEVGRPRSTSPTARRSAILRAEDDKGSGCEPAD